MLSRKRTQEKNIFKTFSLNKWVENYNIAIDLRAVPWQLIEKAVQVNMSREKEFQKQ